MLDKKIEKNKSKIIELTKKSLSVFLAIIISLCSGIALFLFDSSVSANDQEFAVNANDQEFAVNANDQEFAVKEEANESFDYSQALSEFQRLGYFNDADIYNQTRIMMDGDNFLKDGFWMNATITSTGTEQSPSFNAQLRFIVPGYDPSRLKFYVLNKDASMPIETKEYTLAKNARCCTPSLCLSGLNATSYEVHAYLDSLAEENFIAKAEFSCVPAYGGWGICSDDSIPLIDACGNQIVSNTWGPLRLGVAKPYNNKLGSHQYLIALPAEVVPYYARTVKVVFFASERNNQPVNVDKCLYDYIYKGRIYPQDSPAPDCFIEFAPDAQYGIDPSISYEAHFYVDEVKEENFIAKAVGIKNSA